MDIPRPSSGGIGRTQSILKWGFVLAALSAAILGFVYNAKVLKQSHKEEVTWHDSGDYRYLIRRVGFDGHWFILVDGRLINHPDCPKCAAIRDLERAKTNADLARAQLAQTRP
jgi:hypothetical protein